MISIRVALCSLFLTNLILPLVAAAVAPGNAGGLFVVEDALEQFSALKHHPEAMAWRNPEDLGAIDPSIFDHYQGVVRNPRAGTVPIFYASQLDDDDPFTSGGYLHVIRFASRNSTGERLRSNIQRIGSDTEETNPPAGDTWLRSLRFDDDMLFGDVPVPAYKHPGGMAVVDDVLFLAIDQPVSSGSPTGFLLLFDVRGDPTLPLPLKAFPLEHGIDNLAVTRQADGSYLIWMNGDSGNDVNIYETNVGDLRNDALGIALVEAWNPASGLVGAGWPTGFGAHQASTFVREPDGELYLIGMRHPGGLPFTGEDRVDLFRVDEPLPGLFLLTHMDTREFNCVYDGGGGPVDMRLCNMTAAGSAYVSPSGELFLYSMPHDDEDGFDPDIVRMAEFRHRDVSVEDSVLHAPGAIAGGPYYVEAGGTVTLTGVATPIADRPWVEPYDDVGFGDRSIVVDYDDRALLELNEFDSLDGFGDKTSSLRWRAPLGLDIALYDDDDFSDRNIRLRGTGRTEVISDLDSQVVVVDLVEHFDPVKSAGEALDFGDKTSSLRWVGAEPVLPAASLFWDLDGDDVFGEVGAAALHGDEIGAAPVFSASGIAAPSQVMVRVRAQIGLRGRLGAVDTARIFVPEPGRAMLLGAGLVLLWGLERWRRSRLNRSALAALGLALLFASSPVSADPPTPPILPLQGPGVIGQLAIPVFTQAIDVSGLGSYRLTGPAEAGGTSGVVLGVFGMPEPFLIATAGSGNNRFTRGVATLTYEFAVVPPAELECAFPAFAIPGPECVVDVVVIAAGRVQTHGGTILVGDPAPSFIVEAAWSLHDDLGVEVFSDGISIPLSNAGAINDVFSSGEILSLKANHAYRVTMRVDAQAKATTLPAAATALVDPIFAFAPGTAAGYSFRLSDGIGNTRESPVPEPDLLALLGAGVIAIGFRRRR